MIEAYEIGIRLALDDGISAGVQAIRRELTELNRVVDASAAKLASLRDAAGLAVAPSVAEPPRSEEVQLDPEQPARREFVRTVVESLEPAEERPPVAPPTGDRTSARERPADAPTIPPAPPRSIKPQDASAEPVAARAACWTGSASPTEPSAPVTDAIPSDVATALMDAASVAEPAVAPAAAYAVSQRQASPPQMISEPVPQVRSTLEAPDLPPAAAPVQNPDARIEPSAPTPVTAPSQGKLAAAAPATPAAFSRPAAPAARLAHMTERRSGTAPIRSVPNAVREIAGGKQPAPERPRAAAQSDEDADQRTMEVHIYLEGAPLGRWMADHLGRATSRPTASMTGFDPRVGPAWPGAPIG